MIQRIRLVILLARPPVILLLALFTTIGLAQAGESENRVLLAKALLAMLGFLLFSVAVNDLADQAIDQVNLPGDLRRPLAAGTAARHDLVVLGVTAAIVALAASAMLHWAATVVVAAGLALSTAYSLRTRPRRRPRRGCLPAAASRLRGRALPGGVLGARGSIAAGDLALLGGL